MKERSFSTIYIERDAAHLPLTKEIVDRFPRSTQIEIDHYKEVFNRSRQSFRVQKEAQTLILAVRRSGFLYRGSDAAPSFGQKNFFYNTLALNCVYDCEYCYLQGMFPSAALVLFVNTEDFCRAAQEKIDELGSLYLCLSYDTDLLAIAELLPCIHEWLSFAEQNPKGILELRTKSANIKPLRGRNPLQNLVLAWTLSPPYIVKRYEKRAPSLRSRLAALKEAAQAGWPVRLCFDPVIPFEGWEKAYDELFQDLFTQVHPNQIRDVSIGTFRMGKTYHHNMKSVRPDSELLYGLARSDSGLVCLPRSLDREITSYLKESILDHIAEDRVQITESPAPSIGAAA